MAGRVFKKGDRVAFVDDVGGGVVLEVPAPGRVKVRTDEGFVLTELDSVPGGIGLTAFLNRLYGDGDTAVLWHLDGWRLVDDEPRTLAGPETEISALAFVGACLVAGDLGGTLAFWPPDDPHSGAVGDVGAPVTCLVSAGAAMAVGAQDGTIRLVDVPLP